MLTAHPFHSYYSRLRSTQDRQCHLIVGTELWLGTFAVWSYPLLHPWDIQIWEAVPLPKHAHHVPMNALVASRVGRGVAGIRNADHDGDLFAFSNDQHLLDVCKYTPEGSEGSDVQEFQDAEARVKANLSKVPATPLKGVAAYRDYVLQVDTMPVRGICCALFERALFHAMKSPDPKQDGSMVAAIEFGAAGHAGNDCPKDYLSKEVVALALQLMRMHGIRKNAPRSSKALARRLRLTDAFDPLTLLNGLLGPRPLGKVWMPQPAVHLSTQAGAFLRTRLLTPKALGSGMEAEVQRVPLDEVGRLVGHRLLKKQRIQKYAREGRAEELLALAADGRWDDRAPIQSAATLKDRNLF